MNYINTKDTSEVVSFKEATIKGLGNNKGLFVPERIPQLPESFFQEIEQKSDLEIAMEVMLPFVEGSLSKDELQAILEQTISFTLPVKEIRENVSVLELFHGPTQAFKDIGAKFMAGCLSAFQQDKKVTVLVATSGDTGSAVANGFYEVDGVEVKVLFPKGKVSAYQEKQMTGLGKNITAIEVDGVFDDCQALVKQAFSDDELNKKLNLSSANSINVARFLPQMLYYFVAYKQVKSTLNGRPWWVSVPSGNFGNLTAGLIAQKMGLPVAKFIAANNANDTFYQYQQTGEYVPKVSVATYSNAMDVGAPSNFERVQWLFNNDLSELSKSLVSDSYSDEATLAKIKSEKELSDYLLDPHGAVGLMALEAKKPEQAYGTFLATAHPQKFESVVKKALPDFPIEKVDLSNCQKLEMKNDYAEFKRLLLS